MTQTAPHTRILHVSFELSNTKWVLTFGEGSQSPRQVEILAGDFEALSKAIEKAKARFHLPAETKVVSCYEAGRDGFWIHRKLLATGIENLVVDSASIEVSRRKRRGKNDRIDGRALLRMLIRYSGGETKVWSVLRVPMPQDEDARRRHRELEELRRERTRHSNRIGSLLTLHGLRIKTGTGFSQALEQARRQDDGAPLGEHLKAELLRLHLRLELACEQIAEIEKGLREAVKAPEKSGLVQKVAALMSLCAIGPSAWVLVAEFFHWRDFKNRREVGAAAGLTGTPYDSGDSQREQGISKAGNRRVRALMIELAWCWLRYQPGSKLSKWYQTRFGSGGKRQRRVGIVALSRKLLVDLWKYQKFGEIPEGAKLKGAKLKTA